MASPARSGIRMSADERRTAIVAAAVVEFARGGLDGTSTETIAARAGISQPYLFRLFPTKVSLFLAAVSRCFDRVTEAFEHASEGLTGDEALLAMGASYMALVKDSDLLLLQLHAYAASSNPEIRTSVGACWARIVGFVESRTGASADAMRDFFAKGMLCNVVAALGLDNVDGLWSVFAYAPETPLAVRSRECGPLPAPPPRAGGSV